MFVYVYVYVCVWGEGGGGGGPGVFGGPLRPPAVLVELVLNPQGPLGGI